LFNALDNEHVFNKTFAVVSGDREIDTALNRL